MADEVTAGLKKLGLDMSRVNYAGTSHAHGGHVTDRPGGKPKRYMVGTDGLKLALGDASIQTYSR